jgi:hypothetical protein
MYAEIEINEKLNCVRQNKRLIEEIVFQSILFRRKKLVFINIKQTKNTYSL